MRACIWWHAGFRHPSGQLGGAAAGDGAATHRRPGAVHSDTGQSRRRAAIFPRVMQWVRERLHEPLEVRDLASEAAMSERTFLRRFTEATGMPPKAWLQH